MKKKGHDVTTNEDKQVTKNNQEDQPKRKETILIVDDEEHFLMHLEFMFRLEMPDYSIISAQSVHEAWEKFKINKPDLVITDIFMPGDTGLELLRRIKSEDPFTPVIILTCMNDAETVVGAMKIGADEYIEKLCGSEFLCEKIKNILKRSKREREGQYYRNLSEALTSENKMLKERFERLLETKGGGLMEKEAEKYRAICGAVAHGLKSEFMHIGYSLKEIREPGIKSQDVLDESNMIERSLEYSRALLQRLLNFLDMGNLQMEPIELLELIKKTEGLGKPRLPSNIQLQIKVDRDIEKVKISANFEQLIGVLLELINNAAQVLRQKGGTIEIKLEEKNNKAAISVKDDGPGIPVKLRKIILKKQVPSKSGLGLGLYLCSKVITELGGQLNVLTDPGKGTTFTIEFPKIQDKKEL
jgi:signal transduction histidine kinase